MIYTFYSYKGGVGRSMALANIAESFHEKGVRVVLIDWDLEAPGLETFFAPASVDKAASEKHLSEMRARPGLIDMLVTYKTDFPRYSSPHPAPLRGVLEPAGSDAALSAQAVKEQYEYASAVTRKALEEADFPAFLRDRDDSRRRPAPSKLEDFLQELYRPASPSVARGDLPPMLADSPFAHFLQCIHAPDKGRDNGVYLLSAGARLDSDFGRYATTVQEFDWSAFYAAYQGREYFAWFRKQLEAIADVVLIDSRTGVTEMGGVCTRHLPDVVVSFCAPNFQNVDGVVRVISGLNKPEVRRQRDERVVEIMVIPTRIDTSESDRLRDFSDTFRDKIEVADNGGFVPKSLQYFERPLWDLQIPYIARYNYREERVIGPGTVSPDPATQKLIDAYRRIAVHLAVLAPEHSRIRDVFAGEVRAAFPHLRREKPNLAPVVSDTWVDRPHEMQKLRGELLDRAGSPQLSRLAVYGGAGTGKTSLVASVCRDPAVLAAYPNGGLWASADRHWTDNAAFEWLRGILGLSRRHGASTLAPDLADCRFLVVADDVWDLAEVADLFKFFKQGTLLVITRDLRVATQFDPAAVITVGALTVDQALKILKTDTLPRFGPTESGSEPDEGRQALAQQLLTLPLGAVLIRRALDRRMAHGDSLSEALAAERDAFVRHEILAFDQLEAADRSTSIAQSLNASLSRLTPDEESQLVQIAKSGNARPDVRSKEVRRLVDLGLVEVRGGSPRCHPLIRGYLLVEGRLDEKLDIRPRKKRVSSSADRRKNSDIERAREIIRGTRGSLGEIRTLAYGLKDERYFSYARQLFARARQHPEARRQSAVQLLKLVQQQALCTYRDPDLSAGDRFDAAMALLEEGDLGAADPSAETLGLAGAICKYRWRLTGHRRDLEQSAAYYGAGAERGVVHDNGYTGINAAFVLDLLAQLEWQNARPLRHGQGPAHSQSPLTAPETAGSLAGDGPAETPEVAHPHAHKARLIRERILAELPQLATQKSQEWLKKEWWFLATLAEASFGLGRYSEARYWLREGLALGPPEWQLESTTRQLVGLAIAQNVKLTEGSEAHRVLRTIVGDAVQAIRGAIIGKVGLALSGGGFRASLFHIGVLARMAELDMLRHVEVLSCVSGGSIIGAHYYLEVRRLLQEKPDGEISRADYVELVQRLSQNFLTATQRNLRTRLFAGWWANLRTIVQPAYTRTVYLGELFDSHIYSSVFDEFRGSRRHLSDLQIRPQGDRADFNPKLDNWRRSAKAPILLLNATTLNTGHNWQFAVSWMGEPPLGASSPVDRNDILRRMYYWEAPPSYQRVTLGQAVAASACVPFLFDPIEMRNLYPDRSVRLVDGGAHDNQGIVGLIEQESTVMLVSDASGQTSSLDHPSGEPPSVALRTNNILMARVREAEFRELELLRRSSALNGLVYLHLKQDLEASQIDWVDCRDPYDLVDGGSRARSAPLTSYGILRPVQARLAAIRTDLDSFSDAEAYALMLSGYRMATTNFRDQLTQWPFDDDARERWDFLSIEDVASRAPGTEAEHADLIRQLTASADRGFKVWRLAPARMVLLSLTMAAALGAGAWELATQDLWPRIGLVASYLGAGAVGFGLAAWLLHLLFRTRKSVTVIATGVLMITVGWIGALAHLAIFDRAYLQLGKVSPRAERRPRSPP